MIGDAPNGKSQLKEFTSEEHGKSIEFLDQVQPLQVTFSEAGRWEGSLKRLNSRQNLNDFLLFLIF